MEMTLYISFLCCSSNWFSIKQRTVCFDIAGIPTEKKILEGSITCRYNEWAFIYSMFFFFWIIKKKSTDRKVHFLNSFHDNQSRIRFISITTRFQNIYKIILGNRTETKRWKMWIEGYQKKYIRKCHHINEYRKKKTAAFLAV